MRDESGARKGWLYATVGVLAAVVTVVVMLPAAWVVPALSKMSGGRAVLVDPEGSLWHGSARLMLSAGSRGSDGSDRGTSATIATTATTAAELGQGGTLMPYRVSWRTRIAPLFTGRLQVVMQEERALSQPVLIDAQWGQATVYAGNIAVPASLLAGLGAPFNTLDLQGAVQLSWTDWRVLSTGAFGQMVVDIHDASSRVSRLKPLGSYQARFTAAGQVGNLVLTTLGGPLTLNGQGQWHAGHMDFTGRAQSSQEALPNLSGLLNMLGRREDSRTALLEFHQ